MTSNRLPAPPRQCHHCGRRMRPSGAKNPEGVYFCSATDCRAAKNRYNYRRSNLVEQRADAQTECACCGDRLKPRKVRHGDSPLGRWCNKSRCRRHREATLRRRPATVEDYDKLEARILFLQRALVMPRVHCETCGAADAVAGHKHMSPYAEVCFGTGNGILFQDDARALWPDQAGGLPAMLATELAAMEAATDSD